MLAFNEAAQKASVEGALKLREKLNPFIDDFCRTQLKNVCFLGIGGTYASGLQAVDHMKERSAAEVFVQNAAEYITTGNRRIAKGTLVIFSTVSGNTREMVAAVKKAREAGAGIIGFIDNKNSELINRVDLCITYPVNEQIKLFLASDRIMYNLGEFDDYEEYYAQMDMYLADALNEVEKRSDVFGENFVRKYADAPLHYFIGSGSLWGATYSYGMCYWEESFWMRTKTVSCGEFFHGTLEVIEKDTAVTLFMGEDASRPLAERVAAFLPRVCSNYTIIDTKTFELKGISEKYRGSVSHLVMHAVTQRIDAHLEAYNCHPREIRRYYRCLEY